MSLNKNNEVSKAQVADMVRSVFQSVLNGKEVDDNFSLNDESIDSLTRVEIIMELESSINNEFGMKESVPEQFTEGLSTVGELTDKLTDFIEQKLAGTKAEEE